MANASLRTCYHLKRRKEKKKKKRFRAQTGLPRLVLVQLTVSEATELQELKVNRYPHSFSFVKIVKSLPNILQVVQLQASLNLQGRRCIIVDLLFQGFDKCSILCC